MQAREDINLDAEEVALSYECEKKPLKLNSSSPGEVDFLCDLFKGRFNVTANVNLSGKICSVKMFDKADTEGDEAAKREFKNLKTLKHEKIVSSALHYTNRLTQRAHYMDYAQLISFPYIGIFSGRLRI